MGTGQDGSCATFGRSLVGVAISLLATQLDRQYCIACWYHDGPPPESEEACDA
jgi:hypothetical protein